MLGFRGKRDYRKLEGFIKVTEINRNGDCICLEILECY